MLGPKRADQRVLDLVRAGEEQGADQAGRREGLNRDVRSDRHCRRCCGHACRKLARQPATINRCAQRGADQVDGEQQSKRVDRVLRDLTERANDQDFVADAEQARRAEQ